MVQSIKTIVLLRKNQNHIADSYEKWIQLTTKQLDEIREHISTSDFADAATFNREIHVFSERLNAGGIVNHRPR